MTQLVPHRFESFERAIALLTSVENKIPTDNYLKYVCKIELQNARRLQAEYKKQMIQNWNENNHDLKLHFAFINLMMFSDSNSDKEDKNQQSSFDYREESLNHTVQLSKMQPQIQNYLECKQSRYFLKKFMLNHLENFGKISEEITFEYLAKYQHHDYTEFLINKLLKSAFQGKHKFITYQRLIAHVLKNSQQIHQEAKQAYESKDFKLQEIINLMPEYGDIVKHLLPNQSGYLVLKLSDDLRFFYIGYMQITKEREFKFFCKRKNLKQKDHTRIEELCQRLSDMKKNLIKTPIINDKDYSKLIQDQEVEYQKIIAELEQFCSFFTKDIHPFINIPVKPESAQEEVYLDKKGQPIKKDDKKQAKKGGKDEMQVYESPLGTTRGGIESLVLLIDTKLFNLPFETLSVFEEIPAISRDFSLLLLGKRYKNLNFKPELNNSTPINKNQIRYIAYNFKKSDNLNAEPVLKNQANIKFEGVVSSSRVASVGQWQKFLNTSSMLIFYGHPPLLNILTPKLFLDMAEISNTKAFIIFDKINANKTVLEKYYSLDQQGGQKTPLQVQFINSAALLSSIGCSSICMNQWAVEPEQFPQMLDNQIKSMSNDFYFASGLKQYKEPHTVYIDKMGREIDMQALQQQREQKNQSKKGSKKDDKTPQIEMNEDEEITTQKINKLRLQIDNSLYVGVPVLRMQ